MIIRIDKYFFEVKHNIENLTKSLSINLDKVETITKPIYSHIGGYEEKISFNARILLKDISDFKDFEKLIKMAKPLKVDFLDIVKFKYIFITSYNITTSNFIKSVFFSTTYFTKEISIDAVILQDDFLTLSRGIF